MKYRNLTYRDIYHNFIVCEIDEKMTESLKGMQYLEKANCVLLYGYVDHEAGLSLRVIDLGEAREDEELVYFFDSDDKVDVVLRNDSLGDYEVTILTKEDTDLKERYKDKISQMEFYYEDEDLKKIRELKALDPFRDKDYTDDVIVYLINKSGDKEGCWCRLEELNDEGHYMAGILLNEPENDFSCHKGDSIKIYFYKIDNKVLIISSGEIDARLKYRKLEKYIHRFIHDQSEYNLLGVINALKDIKLYVPGYDEDGIFVPDLLESKDELFFPTFTSIENMHMGYGKETIVKVMPIEDILKAVNEKNLQGFVINAFSRQFIVTKDLFELFDII